jgi:hypothetical protein
VVLRNTKAKNRQKNKKTKESDYVKAAGQCYIAENRRKTNQKAVSKELV